MSRSSLALAFALSVVAARAHAAWQEPAPAKPLPAAVTPRAWEHQSSDLPVNPRFKFGAFPNGMRYAWLDNPEPKQRVYLRLHVNAGSLGETDAERGMAHFLEHMAFNGSKHFEPGTLVEWLQKHGLGFGGDTNAFTDFSQTVYMLDLPTADEAMLTDGLQVMRDFADGLTLAEKEVQAEKGVIDGEERERDSAQFRAGRKAMEQVFAGTLVPVRLPIGTKAARDAFDAAAIRAFYERWYRPENCTLLVVGDLAGRDPTALITAAFADLAVPAAPLAPEPPRGAATLKELAGKPVVVQDPEIPTASLEVEMLRPYVAEPDTKATRLEDLALDHARNMVNLRISELAKKPDTPFLGARLGTGGGLEVLDGESLSVICQPAKWREALQSVQTELRRALLHGFEKAELDEIRKDELRALDEAVASEATRASDEFVSDLLHAAENRAVATDAATDRAVYQPAIEALTVEACHAALKKAWSEGTLVIEALGGLDLGADGPKQLAEAWAAGQKIEVAANAEEKEQGWGYASDPGTVGKIAKRQHDAAFDFEDVTFVNEVRLLVKKTDFEQRQILVRACVGEGGLSLEPKQNVQRLFTQATFSACGLGKHSSDDLRRLTAGKQLGAQFAISEDSFTFTGATTAEDLQLQCELLCASVTDPGWREEGTTQFRRALPAIYERQKHEHGGVITTQFVPKLFHDDPRTTFPQQEVLEAVTLDQVKNWIAPAFDRAPITIVVVGDVDVEAAVQAVARTFGALPSRRTRNEWEERRVFPAMQAGLHENYAIDTQVDKALVLIEFATTDGRDAPMRRSLRFLANVVNDRIRVQIREKLGASYSPSASATASTIYPGNGTIVINAMTEPAGADKLAEACLAVTDQLAKDGVTDEEVDRLRIEVLASLRDQQRRNPFWLESLGSLHVGRPLSDLATLVSFHEQLKAAPLTELAKKYLKRELASVAIVRPAAAEKSGAPPGQ